MKFGSIEFGASAQQTLARDLPAAPPPANRSLAGRIVDKVLDKVGERLVGKHIIFPTF